MGIYLNPSNDLFAMTVGSDSYVDKSMLIEITNKKLKTDNRHICVSRPRRFGKSITANMLSAYYSRGCDSRVLFENLKVSKTADFEKHLNKYNVIKVDVCNFVRNDISIDEAIENIKFDIMEELLDEFSNIKMSARNTLEKTLARVYQYTKIPFIFIIDEWDSVFRVIKHDAEGQSKYLDFLRDLLKEKDYVALNYATGIFPIKKYGEHSALNMYHEYSMTNQKSLAEFTGFTSEDVNFLCSNTDISIDEMKKWYDGYVVNGYEIYNPQSVVQAINEKVFDSYWTKTETFEALKEYILLDFDGLKQSIIRMIGGEKIPVDTSSFQNDMINFSCADDVLTLLIHLGYLTYDFSSGLAWIPNNEVMQEFITCIKNLKWNEVVKSVQLSDELLEATLNMNSDKVAELIEQAHQSNTSILKYNDENSLSCVLSLAYYSARNKYEIFRELHSGKGFADLTFIPRRGIDSPAMIIELKYNKSAETAINQIRQKDYTEKLAAFSGEILLVGISYDDNKGHSCIIDKVTK